MGKDQVPQSNTGLTGLNTEKTFCADGEILIGLLNPDAAALVSAEK